MNKVTMNYTGKWSAGMCAIGWSLGLATASATPLDRDSVCYMQLPNQPMVDLTKLCNGKLAPTKKLSATERKAQFLRDFYQQIQNYSAGAEIAAESDPDALIGKANQVCRALQTGDYEPPVIPADSASQPAFRQRADLVEIVVDQAARRSFCPQ
jgi:Protein of unknown function (DUF732)